MKKIFIIFLLLTGFVLAQDSTAIFTLRNGHVFQGAITEINDTYLMVDDKDAILYNVLSSIELTNNKAIQTIKNYLPEVEISEKANSKHLLSFEHIIFKKRVVVEDSTRIPFYNNPTSISAGMFINATEGGFGFTIKTGYTKMISTGLALGGFLGYNEWSPRSTSSEDNIQVASSVSTLIELIPTLYILPSEFDYDTDLFFQVGAGFTLSSSSSFVLGSETTSTTKSNIGGVSALLGFGSFNHIKALGWISVSLNYHLGYSQKIFTNYITLEFGIHL